MNIKNCRMCGKMFNYVSGKMICPACKDEIEQTFQTVRKFVAENSKARINEICEACNVSKSQLEQWIREERLFFSEDSPISIQCENCGANIRTGRFCEKCKLDIARGISNKFTKEDLNTAEVKPAGPRMRFLDN